MESAYLVWAGLGFDTNLPPPHHPSFTSWHVRGSCMKLPLESNFDRSIRKHIPFSWSKNCGHSNSQYLHLVRRGKHSSTLRGPIVAQMAAAMHQISHLLFLPLTSPISSSCSCLVLLPSPLSLLLFSSFFLFHLLRPSLSCSIFLSSKCPGPLESVSRASYSHQSLC